MGKLTKDEALKRMEELLIEAGWDYANGKNRVTFNTIFFEEYECLDETYEIECCCDYWRLIEHDGSIYFAQCDEEGILVENAFKYGFALCLEKPSDVEEIKRLIRDITPLDFQPDPNPFITLNWEENGVTKNLTLVDLPAVNSLF